MPVIDLYSSRLTQAQSENANRVFQFDKVPAKLAIQLANIVKNTLGTASYHFSGNASEYYKAIQRILAQEHGLTSLSGESDSDDDVIRCLSNPSDTLLWLDCVELSLRLIENARRNHNTTQRQNLGILMTAQEAIDEANERFKRAGFGYRYEQKKIIRIDNEFTFSNIAKPALALLSDARFAGANEEFIAAHDHFKNSEFRDCAVDALNALESVMKAICELKGWTINKGARATDLMKVLRSNQLLPEFTEQSFDQLFATLKTGLPVLRNEIGGHGQGSEQKIIPSYIASYALNLSASKIVLLFQAFQESEGTTSS